MYHAVKIGRIVTEMVRPSVKGIVDRRRYGGWDYERLRIAGLARCIQTKMALHSCTTKYCLKNRTTCRFFFPWPSHRHCCYHKQIASHSHMRVAVEKVCRVCVARPEQPQQQYDENTERVAGMRRLFEDDDCWA